jgi:hypothetical protein
MSYRSCRKNVIVKIDILQRELIYNRLYLSIKSRNIFSKDQLKTKKSNNVDNNNQICKDNKRKFINKKDMYLKKWY